MKNLFKKTFFVYLFLFCILFSLTTLCGDVYAGGAFGGNCGDCCDSASVPEPSTLLLLAAGAGVCYFKKKKNKK